jgi:NADH-quinone oxidoreductase subunit L
VLSAAWDAGGWGKFCAVVGLAGAALTTFYMFRLYFRAFWGREPEGGYARPPHEGGLAMAIPVVTLAVLSTVGGFLQVPGGWHSISDWLEPALLSGNLEPTHLTDAIVSTVSVLLALAGIAVAWWAFAADPGRRLRLAGRAPGARRLLLDEWRFDAVYEEALVQPGRDLGDVMAHGGERYGFQGAMEGVARSLIETGRGLSWAQSGLVRAYAFAMVAGAAVIGVVFILALR